MQNEDDPGAVPALRTGDAGVASAAIGRWLALRPGPPPIGKVLGEMRAALEQLCRAPVLRDDALASRLLDDMARCEDMEELAAVVDRLDARVQALLDGDGEREGPARTAERRRPMRTFLRL